MIKKNIVIIGSGPAGYDAAIRLKNIGQDVSIIEKHEIGGVCLNYGCIPTKVFVSASNKYSSLNNFKRYGISLENKQLEFGNFRKFQNAVITKLRTGMEHKLVEAGIEFIKGEAKIIKGGVIEVSGLGKIEYDKLIISVGSRPLIPEKWKNIKNVFDSENFWYCDLNPDLKDVVIIGGGVIGCEYASSLAELGFNVSIIDRGEYLLSNEDLEICEAIRLELLSKGVKIYLNSQVDDVIQEDEKLKILLKTTGFTIDSSIVICCMGRIRNLDKVGLENVDLNSVKNFQFAENIYLIGDCVNGPQLAHKGYYDAMKLEQIFNGKKVEINYQNIPMAIFTNPEISRVGLTKIEANNIFKEENILTVKVNYPEVGKAVAENALKGFLLMHVNRLSREILGISIFGYLSAEFSSISSLIVSHKMTVDNLEDVVFAHPVISEIFKVASYKAFIQLKN